MSKQVITILGTERQRDINRDMFDYAPKFYEELAESNAIIDTESAELKQYYGEIADVLNQYFIDTATWGLSKWEEICGITPDESKPYSERRSVVKSKIRGIGTVTTELIKNVADSYTNGDVEVTEQNAEYTVQITFTSVLGRPPNIEDAKASLREIIPAHLAIDFRFRYFTVNEVQAFTIADIETKTLDNFAPFNEDNYDA